VVGLLRSAPSALSAEMGPVIILPKFQRTHISTHAIGTLLKYVLDMPEEGGIGYRRVYWICDPANAASKGAALRMGFKEEGVMRWYRQVPAAKECGIEAGKGRGDGKGIHGLLLAQCWDDWEDGGRELVERQMSREL